MTQVSATSKNFMVFMNMTPEDLATQQAYWDAVAYLQSFNIPVPELKYQDQVAAANKPGVDAQFTLGAVSFDTSAILLLYNPLPVVTDLMRAGLIAWVPYIKPYVPPTHEPAPVTIDVTDLSRSIGPPINGFDKPRFALMPAFQGKIALGTLWQLSDGRRIHLVDSNSPFNRDGVWEIV